MKNLPKALSKNLLYLPIINVNSKVFRTLEILDHPFELKIMLNTTDVLFTKVIVCVMKTMLLSP